MNESGQPPEDYEGDVQEFMALYFLLWTWLLALLGRLIRLPSNPTTNSLLQLEREVTQEVDRGFRKYHSDTQVLIAEKVTKAYTDAITYSKTNSITSPTINLDFTVEVNNSTDNDTSTDTEVELNDSHKVKLEKLIKQSQDDLLAATTNTHNGIKRLVRKVVSKEISGAGKSGMIGKRSNMALRIEQQLREQFLQNGIKDADVAIIDRAKRKWKLRTYSEMVTRTKMNNAFIEAIREEGRQQDFDLAIISTKPDTEDACLNYEGMIISLNGKTEGFLTYDQIKATKLCFHPNCGHFVRPVGGIEWVPKDLLAIHEKKMAKYMRDKSTLKQQTSQDAI